MENIHNCKQNMINTQNYKLCCLKCIINIQDTQDIDDFYDIINVKIQQIMDVLIIGQDFDRYSKLKEKKKYNQQEIIDIMTYNIDQQLQNKDQMYNKQIMILKKENEQLRDLFSILNVALNINSLLESGKIDVDTYKKYYSYKKENGQNDFSKEFFSLINMDPMKFQEGQQYIDIAKYIIDNQQKQKYCQFCKKNIDYSLFQDNFVSNCGQYTSGKRVKVTSFKNECMHCKSSQVIMYSQKKTTKLLNLLYIQCFLIDEKNTSYIIDHIQGYHGKEACRKYLNEKYGNTGLKILKFF